MFENVSLVDRLVPTVTWTVGYGGIDKTKRSFGIAF